MGESRIEFDSDKYYKRIKSNKCLFCALGIHGIDESREYYLYENDYAMAVLDRYPTQYGYSLVFPKDHYEHIHLLDTKTYLKLQAVLHGMVKAVQIATGAERVYTACLGSQQLSPHIHYHVVPINSKLPLEEQQWNALDRQRGVLKISEKRLKDVANKITRAMEGIVQI